MPEDTEFKTFTPEQVENLNDTIRRVLSATRTLLSKWAAGEIDVDPPLFINVICGTVNCANDQLLMMAVVPGYNGRELLAEIEAIGHAVIACVDDVDWSSAQTSAKPNTVTLWHSSSDLRALALERIFS